MSVLLQRFRKKLESTILSVLLLEAYSESHQTSKMDLVASWLSSLLCVFRTISNIQDEFAKIVSN